VILNVALACAGVLGAVELVGYLRQRLEPGHALQISTAATALGLIGAVLLTQHALQGPLAPMIDMAYNDYYPTGESARRQRDRQQPQAWYGAVYSAVADLSQRPPEQNIVLPADPNLLLFEPYWGFQHRTPHYANPLADYDARSAEIRQWARATSSQEFVGQLDGSRFEPPNVFVFRRASDGKLTMDLSRDTFPRLPNIAFYGVSFDPALFASAEFVRRDVGPFAVIVRR
jgi:galactan 5-O-arabinofuranosyltransferase